MKRLLALLVLCLPIYLFAQGFGSFSHDQPYFAKDTSGSVSNFLNDVPPGVAFWWAASDLTNSPVAAWYDRIQSRAFVQPTGGNQPTWATNAVIFDNSGSQFLRLTNPILFWGSGVSSTNLFVVVATTSVANSTKVLINANDGVNGLFAFIWKGFSGFWRAVNNTDLVSDSPINVNREIIYGGYDGTTPKYYTNGVTAVEGIYSYNANIDYLGRMYDGTFPWYGTIKELIIWTNVAPAGRAYFTTNEVLQIHHYVTNKFGPSTF